MRRRALLGLVAGLACLVVAPLRPAAPARAEVSQSGDLITSFRSDLTPKKLPRHAVAPVSVRVAGSFRTADGAPLPQLRTISVAINGAGRLDDAGLPTCRPETIQPATEAAARRLCGGAIVGSGHVTVGVRIPNQAPFAVPGRLLAFNGPAEGGVKLILAQVYSRSPPGAFVLRFKVRERAGLFGTVMTTTLPASARGWAHLSHFDMTLHRTYRHGGAARSYVSAACAAPAGFPGAVFPFAKATYDFADGRHVTTTVVRSCKVRSTA
jgi:hypothetical protein